MLSTTDEALERAPAAADDAAAAADEAWAAAADVAKAACEAAVEATEVKMAAGLAWPPVAHHCAPAERAAGTSAAAHCRVSALRGGEHIRYHSSRPCKRSKPRQ